MSGEVSLENLVNLLPKKEGSEIKELMEKLHALQGLEARLKQMEQAGTEVVATVGQWGEALPHIHETITSGLEDIAQRGDQLSRDNEALVTEMAGQLRKANKAMKAQAQRTNWMAAGAAVMGVGSVALILGVEGARLGRLERKLVDRLDRQHELLETHDERLRLGFQELGKAFGPPRS